MFRVTVDLTRGYFEVATHGFWNVQTVADFGATLERTVRQIRATGRTPLSLCDHSNAIVQSQEVIAAFVEMMENPAVRSGRVAVYTSRALPRTQAARANQKHPEFRFFTNRQGALAWLFEVPLIHQPALAWKKPRASPPGVFADAGYPVQ